ncbi:MAG: UDP-2,3-diacylglucosamine diphosphatase [bacterium]|nr:UDP-2,3-diacylglucosamine diphosphatase [bacterium]
MQHVLGTAISHLAPGDGPAFLISDLHVPADRGRAFELLESALGAAAAARARLFVLGDLFDSYVTARQIEVGVWRDVAASLRRAVDAGVRIDVLPGNRDFLLGAEFERASGVRLHPGGMRLRLGGVNTLLLHGDELCQNDVPYQKAKRWLRSSAVRLLARNLPLGAALRAAERARKKSATVIASGDQSRFLPTRAAVDAALSTGVRRLIFGHIHRHARVELAGREVFVLPAFDAAGVGFRIDRIGLAAVRFGARDAVEAVAEAATSLPLG